MDKLKQKIRSFSSVSDSDLDYAMQFYKRQEISKGDYFVKAGQYVKEYYFLEKGCVYYYNLKDGQIKVMEFFTEGDFFTDLYSYLEGIPSNSYLVASEDTIVYTITKEEVQQAFDHSHDLERFGRLSMQRAFIKTFRRVVHLNHLSNEERYLRLLQKRPSLFQRVPQYLIASYLGLTPVGLSKIRKRLIHLAPPDLEK